MKLNWEKIGLIFVIFLGIGLSLLTLRQPSLRRTSKIKASFSPPAEEFQTAKTYYQTELVKPAVRNPNRWGAARCNDGTPFAFKIEKPTNDQTNKWIIYLQGGGMCEDNAFSCVQRANETPGLITSLLGVDGQKSVVVGNKGIFNHDSNLNPEFYDAYKVYAHYCSSDAWTGKTVRLRKTSAGDWYFSGRINVRAMLESLRDLFGLDDSNPETKILFGGGSAGCMGVYANAQVIYKMFPNSAKNKRLKLVTDGCFMPDFDNPSYRVGESNDSIRSVMIKAYDFWGAAINALCENDRELNGDHPGSCFMAPILTPFITSYLPNLVANSTIDTWALKAHHIDWRSPTNQDALNEWRNLMLNELNKESVNWVFSGGTPSYHTLLLKDEIFNYGPTGGPTFYQLLRSYWIGDSSQKVIFGNP